MPVQPINPGQRSSRRLQKFALIATAAVAGLASRNAVLAAGNIYTWNSSGTDWGTATDWSPNTVPTSTDTALFIPRPIGTMPQNPNLAGAQAVGTLLIGNNAFIGNYTFTGANTLTIGTGGLSTAGFGSTTISGPILAGAAAGNLALTPQTGSGLTLAGATTASTNAGNDLIYGGTLTLDNTSSNTSGRLSASNIVAINGGTLSVLGNSAGTTFNVGSLNTATTLGSEGANTVSVTAPSVASGPTVLHFGNTTAAALQAVTGLSYNFAGVGGVLGSANGPQITFATAPFTSTTIGVGMLNASATSSKVGFAIASDSSGVGWAGYGTNGIYILSPSKTVSDDSSTGLQNLTEADVADFTPAANTTITVASVPTSSGSTTAPTPGLDAVITGSLRIAPAGTGAVLDLATNNADLATNGIMLNGSNDFTITGSATSVLGGSATKYIYVTNPTTTLNIGAILSGSGDGLNGSGQTSTGNPVNIAGPGFVNLTGSTYQIGITTNTRLNLLNGTLRGNATQLGGFSSTAASNVNALAFRGGVLEITGGSNGTGTSADFQRSISNATTAGDVNWVSATAGDSLGGSGGFSAYGSNASVNIGGLASPSTLTWGVAASGFVQNGFALIFGSTQSNAQLTFLNGIALDSGTAGTYASREVKVIGGAGSDATNFDGVISGSSSTDMLKAGTGTLILSAINTYSGNTLVQNGTLVLNSSSATGSGTVNVGSGATLTGTGTSTGLVVVSTGGTIKPGAGAANASMSIGGGTVSGNANFTINSSSANASDELVSAGSISLGGASLLSVTDIGTNTALTSASVVLINAAGGLNGTFSNFANGSIDTINGNTYTVNYTTDDVLLNINSSSAPEPSSLALLAIGGVGMLTRRRRRAANKIESPAMA